MNNHLNLLHLIYSDKKLIVCLGIKILKFAHRVLDIIMTAKCQEYFTTILIPELNLQLCSSIYLFVNVHVHVLVNERNMFINVQSNFSFSVWNYRKHSKRGFYYDKINCLFKKHLAGTATYLYYNNHNTKVSIIHYYSRSKLIFWKK